MVGVMAEWRMRRPNALARLRNAGFCRACFSIGALGAVQIRGRSNRKLRFRDNLGRIPTLFYVNLLTASKRSYLILFIF